MIAALCETLVYSRNKNKKHFESYALRNNFTQNSTMTKSSISFFLLLLMLCASFNISAQKNSDYQVLKRTEAAKKMMDEGRYDAAYTSFRDILSLGKVLPTNLSYYFAETLYHIGQYQNSQNFVDKYMKITGKGGDYFNEATELSKLLNYEFNQISSCKLCDVSGYRLVPCTHCNGVKSITESCNLCNAAGLDTCKKCEGEGVLIIVDVFDEKKYQTCDKCNGIGYHTCKTCHGNKSIQLNCPVCLGSGFEKSEGICDHLDHKLN